MEDLEGSEFDLNFTQVSPVSEGITFSDPFRNPSIMIRVTHIIPSLLHRV